MPCTGIGCDISRAFLDLNPLPYGRPTRVENAADAIAACAETLAPERWRRNTPLSA